MGTRGDRYAARMAEIRIEPLAPGRYRVEIREGSGRSVHEVTASEDEIARYGAGASGERLVEASFEFLLERESKESILRSFALPTIERYFPEYPREIRRRLERS